MTIWNRIFPFRKTGWRDSLAALGRHLPRPETLHGTWLHRWFGNRIFHPGLWKPSRSSLAMGLAVGLFFGMLPTFGLQIALALLFGLFLRGHFPTAVLGTFITNPLTTPGILVAQYGAGRWLACHLWLEDPGLSPVLHHGIWLAMGSLASAFACALGGYLGIWALWGWLGDHAARLFAGHSVHADHEDKTKSGAGV